MKTLESSIEDDNLKVENGMLSPSTSQDTDKEAVKLEHISLFDKIGELFDIKTKIMTTDLTNKISDIANNAKEIKSEIATNIANSAKEMKSEMKSELRIRLRK